MKLKYTLLFFILSLKIYAQDDLLKMLDSTTVKEIPYTHSTFKTTRLINAHSVETTEKNVLDLRITHRFGEMGKAYGGGIETFYGLDNASNIRIAFEYGVTDRLTLAFGRNKFDKALDGYAKFKILKQRDDNKMPISLTVFANTALSTAKTTLYKEKFTRRLSYVYQAIIARKFNERLSLQLMPAFVHRNYVERNELSNNIFALGLGFRYKFTKRSSVLIDFSYIFDNNYLHPFATYNGSKFFMPLGLGYELETGGHVFSVNVTNSAGVIENHFLAQTAVPWNQMGIKFGFNISRGFGLGKKPKNESSE